jgi:hemerythrin-like domain-containing protein
VGSSLHGVEEPTVVSLLTRQLRLKLYKENLMGKTNSTPPRDAIALLTEDHQRVRELLGEMEETTERAVRKREELLATIEQELEIHTKIEGDIFYPAFRDAAKKKDDKDLYYEALEEHHVVDMVMPEFKETKADSEEFGAKAKVLKDLVEHHAGEEEKEMFPRAKKLMDREQLLDLGQQLVQAKASLMSEGAKARR